jgi:hypothetical protein
MQCRFNAAGCLSLSKLNADNTHMAGRSRLVRPEILAVSGVAQRTNCRPSEQACEDMNAMMVRILGASLVGVSLLAIVFLREMVTAAHASTSPELLLSFLIVATGLPGLAMAIEGASLFGYCEPPTRSR